MRRHRRRSAWELSVFWIRSGGKEDLPVLLILTDPSWSRREKYDREFDRRSVEVSKGLKRVYEQIAKRRGIAFLAASDVALPRGKDSGA